MSKRPNFLFILADDLGFSDIGCYGAEIDTPNIDALAKEGVRMINHHTASACSPTRAMILSGTDAHLGGLGVLIEHKANEAGRKRWAGKAGYEGFLNQDVATIPEILSDNGYFTVNSGKWHLGARPEAGPWARGFQKAFSMIPGCCNHFGWEPILETGYAGMPIGGRPVHAEEGKRVDIPANKTDDPEGFYSTQHYTKRMIQFLEDRSEADKEKPFFGYLTYTAPHWPLQAPRRVIDKYKGKYDEGPFALRQRRLARLTELGIISPDVVPHEVVHPVTPEWEDFTDHEKALSCRAMETYAAMVDQIDTNVGEVVEYLKQTGEYDNTFIVFMSDNGAEGAALEASPVMGERIKEAIHKFYDNSLENIGAWNSYTCIHRSLKTDESVPLGGGILVPCVIKPPKGVFPDWSAGQLSKTFTTCMDFAPTFLDLAGVSAPAKADNMDSKVVFRGRQVHAFKGHSWIPFYGQGKALESDEVHAVYPRDKYVGWELYARAALRKGDWKIVHLPKLYGGKGENDNPDGWELFNVVKDPGETSDVGDRYPEKLKELLRDWDDYVVDCQIVWGESATRPGLSAEEAPHLNESDLELQRSWMQTVHGEVPVMA
ncbi:hypothetical protein EHS25_005412 [Saitozyma podzolica]|uniref:Sulfatase N-terminal domain-containing protein n=1 Tax=Saitozyma podzolica TaxID=1890683 RepID=A0A427XYC7_9TREE|nr:hypothetical protein EHS25_005412 [Saitozyma podzolica]